MRVRYRTADNLKSNISSNNKLSVIGKIFLAVFFVVLFEGAIRKWISPALTVPLVFLRDCLVLFGVFWALKFNKFITKNIVFKALVGWTVIVVLWGLLQLIINNNSPFIYLIGLRFWLLYLWFGCVSALAMTEHDFNVIKKTLMLVILYTAPLILIQFYSSPSAFINRQVDGDEDKVFRLTADFVRTTGLFSFTLGQTTLLAMVSPFVLSSLVGSGYLFRRKGMVVLIFIALAISTMLSGSRSALLMFFIMFMAMILFEFFFSKKKRNATKVIILILSLAVVVSVPFLFSSAFDATAERVVSANESEVLSDRVVTLFLGEPEIRERASFIGYGLGMGTNLVGFLSNTQFALGEAETGRILMEGGLIGFMFVFFKIAIILVAIKKAFFISRRTGDSLPILLWVTLLVAIFSWSIIGQLTANALGYMFFGLGLASFRYAGFKK